MKRFLTITAGLAILATIYWQLDLSKVIAILTSADPLWMVAGIGLLIPLVWLAGARLCHMAPLQAPLGLGEAIRLNLAAAVLNMIVPSKMGDLAKSWFFRQRGHLSGSLALALVVFERISDMLALLLWCAVSLAFVPSKDPILLGLSLAVVSGLVAGVLVLTVRSIAYAAIRLLESVVPERFRERIGGLRDGWAAMHDYFWSDHRRLVLIGLLAVSIWFVNLFEVWVFLRALRADVPLLVTLAITPIVIVIGLLPVTFAGVGTRDAAVIYFFRGYLTPETAAALGLLLTLRYVLLGLAGLPFLGEVSAPAGAGGK